MSIESTSKTDSAAVESDRIIQLGRAVLEIEARALHDLAKNIDKSFALAADYMLRCNGRIVVLGMGKSGHIGSKMYW